MKSKCCGAEVEVKWVEHDITGRRSSPSYRCGKCGKHPNRGLQRTGPQPEGEESFLSRAAEAEEEHGGFPAIGQHHFADANKKVEQEHPGRWTDEDIRAEVWKRFPITYTAEEFEAAGLPKAEFAARRGQARVSWQEGARWLRDKAADYILQLERERDDLKKINQILRNQIREYHK